MWVALLCAAAAAGVLWMQSERQHAGARDVPTTDVGAARGAPAATEYAAFAAALQVLPGKDATGPLAEGLRHLAGTLAALGIGDTALHIDLRVAAEHLLLNPGSVANARLVREHLIAVGEALPPGPDRERISSAAQSLDPATPLPDQAQRMEAFFRASADAVR